MPDIGIPIRSQTTQLFGNPKQRGYGTLLLYPDKLVFVSSGAVRAGMSVGFIVVLAIGFLAPPHVGPGALGGGLGTVVGYLVGAAIARGQAPAKVARVARVGELTELPAGVGDITVIPLDSITGLESRKLRRRGPQRLFVTTAKGAQYAFGVKLDRWSADLGNALAARGSGVYHVEPQRMVVEPPRRA